MMNARGMVLITGLLFLMVLALLGVAAMTSNLLQEKMAGNARDVDTAFQAGEAALRDAELDVARNLNPLSGFNQECNGGLCLPPTTSTPRWQSMNWNDPDDSRVYGSATGAPPLPGLGQQPRYIVELLPNVTSQAGNSIALGVKPPPAPVAYRITVFATGKRSETSVVLQSVYFKN